MPSPLDIHRTLEEGAGFTPSEQRIAKAVLSLGERVATYRLTELANAAAVSAPTLSRFCSKLGYSGFKELKIALVKSSALDRDDQVDINFPFSAGDDASLVSGQMSALYRSTIDDMTKLLDSTQLNHAADLLLDSAAIDIYARSHNRFPAQMFEERLLSAGKHAIYSENWEQEIRRALASDHQHVAVIISYSGLSYGVEALLPVLRRNRVPVIFIGSPHVVKMHPGLAAYLTISDKEHFQNRIAQFASHVAVQFVLDTLFGCMFAKNYERHMAFLKHSVPYTVIRGRFFEPSAQSKKRASR